MPFREWVELAANAVEGMAVAIMVCSILIGTVSWVFNSARKIATADENYRTVLGKTLLLGLGLLVAADIIRTVALDLTPMNIALLSSLVVVRTFLSWTLTVEVEGRWPWEGPLQSGSGSAKRDASATEPRTRNDVKA